MPGKSLRGAICAHPVCQEPARRRCTAAGAVVCLCSTHAARAYRSGTFVRPRDFDTEERRWCVLCREYISVECFPTASGRPDSACGSCRREYWFNLRLLRDYGMSRSKYDHLAAVGCSVCGGRSKLVVDHDHKTGSFRGILCDDCNQALGRAHDNPSVLRQLADYLERTGC